LEGSGNYLVGVLQQNLSQRTEENLGVADVSAEIRTEYLLNRNLESYLYGTMLDTQEEIFYDGI
jgi:hypothetical protein